MNATPTRISLRSSRLCLLTRPEPLVEGRKIDETAGVAALADAALAVERFDGETDHPALHRDHPRRGPHQRADRRPAEVADTDLGSDPHPPWLAVIIDCRGRHPFPFHDPQRRPEH